MITVSRDMTCPPQAVLAVLADGWSYATWVVGASRIRGVDPTWPTPGSRISHSFGVWPAVINDSTQALSWNPAGTIELQARGWPAGEATVKIAVRPRAAGGCTVQMSEDVVRGPGKLVPGFVRQAALVPRNVESLRRLAFLAEGRPA